jgi:xylulokinase
VMEGVAFSLADGVRVLREAGTDVARLRVVGGGSRSEGWAGLIASAAGVVLERQDDAASGAALGAAWLGHAACHGALPPRQPRPARSFEPDPAQAERLLARLARYRRLYPRLAPEFACGGAG